MSIRGSRRLPEERHKDLDLAARVNRLTAGQRACLELVDDHATSKEIARQLGISRHTVDARLRQAMQILGVSSRREAAIIWRAATGAGPYQPLAYQPSRIVNRADGPDSVAIRQSEGGLFGDDDAFGPSSPSFADAGQTLPTFADLVHASPAAGAVPQQAGATPGPGPIPGAAGAGGVSDASSIAWHASWPTRPDPVPSLRLWGGANDLTITQRIIGILIVTIIAMLAFGLLLSGLSALAQLRS